MGPASGLTDITGGFGRRTLDRPAKQNDRNGPVRAEIRNFLITWNKEPAARAIIVTGSKGRAFSICRYLEDTQNTKGWNEGA